MIFESVFMVRGGSVGYDWGQKLITAIIAILVCVYDYKTNEKRLDYFWVFLIAMVIWSVVELTVQLIGVRVLHEKYLFGLNVTTWLWLTIPIQAMAEAGAIAILGLYFGDRIRHKKTRKTNIIIFVLFLAFFLTMLRQGINYNNVNIGGTVPSRREMLTLDSIIRMSIVAAPAIYWLITTDSNLRKRGLSMFLFMIIWAAWWTFLSWLTGQRWIEIGTKHADGTYSGLHRASPLVEFLVLSFDVIIEIGFLYVSYLAIPYILGLIKSKETENK